MPRRSVILLAAAVAAFLIPGSSKAEITSSRVNADCKACDDQATKAVTNFQTIFGTYAKAIDRATYYCGVFSKLISCYTECLHGTFFLYNSEWKPVLERLYSTHCDPTCYVAVLPWCYTKFGRSYDIAGSCNGSSVNSDIKTCAETELFVKQNCTGVCTVGQRKAAFFMFSVASYCSISFNTAYACYDAATYCSDYEFGGDGSAYIAYSNDSLKGSNQLACSAYGDHYSACMQQAVSGVVVLGSNPEYAITYQSPCDRLASEVKYLQNYARTRLAGQVCSAPNKSFNDICQAYVTTPATTTSIVRPTSTTGGRSSISAASTVRQAFDTNPASLSSISANSTARPTISSADRAATPVVPVSTQNTDVGSRDTDRLSRTAASVTFKQANASAGRSATAPASALCFAVLGFLSSVIEL